MRRPFGGGACLTTSSSKLGMTNLSEEAFNYPQVFNFSALRIGVGTMNSTCLSEEGQLEMNLG